MCASNLAHRSLEASMSPNLGGTCDNKHWVIIVSKKFSQIVRSGSIPQLGVTVLPSREQTIRERTGRCNATKSVLIRIVKIENLIIRTS